MTPTAEEMMTAAMADLVDEVGQVEARRIMEMAIAKYRHKGGASVLEYLTAIWEAKRERRRLTLH